MSNSSPLHGLRNSCRAVLGRRVRTELGKSGTCSHYYYYCIDHKIITDYYIIIIVSKHDVNVTII